MKTSKKIALVVSGAIAAIALVVKANEETDEDYFKRKLSAVNSALAEVEVRWNTDHMSLSDAVHLQDHEKELRKQKDFYELKLEPFKNKLKADS